MGGIGLGLSPAEVVPSAGRVASNMSGRARTEQEESCAWSEIFLNVDECGCSAAASCAQGHSVLVIELATSHECAALRYEAEAYVQDSGGDAGYGNEISQAEITSRPTDAAPSPRVRCAIDTCLGEAGCELVHTLLLRAMQSVPIQLLLALFGAAITESIIVREAAACLASHASC